MKVDELYASIEANRPGRDDVVYLERRGDEYDWWIVAPDGAPQPVRSDHLDPDVWMSFSATWPDEPEEVEIEILPDVAAAPVETVPQQPRQRRVSRILGRYVFGTMPKRGERWKPYRTAASWYLWRAAERAKPIRSKPSPKTNGR